MQNTHIAKWMALKQFAAPLRNAAYVTERTESMMQKYLKLVFQMGVVKVRQSYHKNCGMWQIWTIQTPLQINQKVESGCK